MPPLTTLKRGQLGSVVPALLLIGLGAWLTLTTTSGTPPDPLLVAAVVVGGIVVSLLAQWLGTGRWSRGALFFALLLLLVVRGDRLLGSAKRTRPAARLSAADRRARRWRWCWRDSWLARSTCACSRRACWSIVAGGVGLIVTLGLLPANLLTAAAPFAPVVLVVVLVIWLLPLVFRRRQILRSGTE